VFRVEDYWGIDNTDYYDKSKPRPAYTHYIAGCDRRFCATKQLPDSKVHLLITRIHAHAYRDWQGIKDMNVNRQRMNAHKEVYVESVK
jgi:hypothetical protein